MGCSSRYVISNCIDINQLEIPTTVDFFDTMLSRKRKGTLKSTLRRGSIPHESILLVPLCTFTISVKGISTKVRYVSVIQLLFLIGPLHLIGV